MRAPTGGVPDTHAGAVGPQALAQSVEAPSATRSLACDSGRPLAERMAVNWRRPKRCAPAGWPNRSRPAERPAAGARSARPGRGTGEVAEGPRTRSTGSPARHRPSNPGRTGIVLATMAQWRSRSGRHAARDARDDRGRADAVRLIARVAPDPMPRRRLEVVAGRRSAFRRRRWPACSRVTRPEHPAGRRARAPRRPARRLAMVQGGSLEAKGLGWRRRSPDSGVPAAG